MCRKADNPHTSSLFCATLLICTKKRLEAGRLLLQVPVGAAVAKALATYAAQVRLLPAVDPQVLTQRGSGTQSMAR